MERLFVPYVGERPAAVEINGHRVLIISSESEDLLDELEAVGGDTVRVIEIGEPDADETEVIAGLAADINGGVVLTPPGVKPSSMIESLQQELPWLQ